MDTSKLILELEMLCAANDFERICEIADFFFDQELFKEAEAAYWKLIFDDYRADGAVANEFLSKDIWLLYEQKDFHEFHKSCNSIPSITKAGAGDRANLAQLCEDIGWAAYHQSNLIESERMFRIAVALQPFEPSLHFSLGRALEAQEKQLSLNAYERSRELSK